MSNPTDLGAERLAEIIDSAMDAIISTDEQHRIILFNKAAEVKFQRSADTVLGQPFDLLMPERFRTAHQQHMQDFIKSGDTTRGLEAVGAALGFRASGEEFPVDGAISKLQVGPKKNFTVILRDTTRAKREAARRVEENAKLFQADKMIALGTLVFGVAHEINNPNNTIRLSGPLLQEIWAQLIPLLDRHEAEHGDFLVGRLPYSDVKLNVEQLLKGIVDGSERIGRIVQDLRDFARPTSSALDEQVNISDVVMRVTSLLKGKIKSSTDNFRVQYDASLPKILGNTQQLEHAVLNLIQNACDALRAKSEAIYVETRPALAGPGVAIVVRDEGAGIPEDVLPHIQDPFFTTKRAAGGVGLGLFISAQIIERHKGHLEVDSTPGQGTIVIVTLPLPGSPLT